MRPPYVPDNKSKPTVKQVAVEWLGRAALAFVLGPFAIIILAAIFGTGMPGGWLGVWFMSVLTIGGVLMTLEALSSAKRHGLAELGCAVPLALITIWWAYVLLKELRTLA